MAAHHLSADVDVRTSTDVQDLQLAKAQRLLEAKDILKGQAKRENLKLALCLAETYRANGGIPSEEKQRRQMSKDTLGLPASASSTLTKVEKYADCIYQHGLDDQAGSAPQPALQR